MRKGEGLAQQIRGHRRIQKTLNRKLNRYPSDLKKVEGKYAEWLNAKIQAEADVIAEEMKENEKRNDS